MNLNDEKGTDPTVEAIVEMFPEDFLRNTARESGFAIRERKIDPVILFWVLTLGFGVRFLSTILGLKRKYEEKAGVKLSISSFYERFTPKMVDFLQRCVLHAIEFQAQQPGRVLGDKLNRFKDLVIQDSTITRLHESLAKICPPQGRRESLRALRSPVSLVRLPIVLNLSGYTLKGRQRLKYFGWDHGSRVASCSSISDTSSTSSSTELTAMAVISLAG